MGVAVFIKALFQGGGSPCTQVLRHGRIYFSMSNITRINFPLQFLFPSQLLQEMFVFPSCAGRDRNRTGEQFLSGRYVFVK